MRVYGNNPNEYEVKQFLDETDMRRGLLGLLWSFKRSQKKEGALPIPLFNDEQIQEELRRILLPPRKKFLGIF